MAAGFVDEAQAHIKAGNGGAGAVSFRFRDGTQDNGIAVDEAVERIVTAVRERR